MNGVRNLLTFNIEMLQCNVQQNLCVHTVVFETQKPNLVIYYLYQQRTKVKQKFRSTTIEN